MAPLREHTLISLIIGVLYLTGTVLAMDEPRFRPLVTSLTGSPCASLSPPSSRKQGDSMGQW